MLRISLLVLFAFASCSKIRSSQKDLYTSIEINEDWGVAAWASDRQIILHDEQGFFLFDVSSQKIEKRIVDSPGLKSVRCVDRDSKEAHFAEVTVRKSGTSTSTSYSYGKYLDINTGTIKELAKDYWLDRKQMNCLKVKRGTKDRNSKKSFKDWYLKQHGLVKQSDGTFYIYQSQQSDDEFLYRWVKGKDFAKKSFKINKTKYFRDYKVSYDVKNNLYLFYQPTSNFSASNKEWPLNAVLFNKNDNSLKFLPIPKGPWLKDYSFWDQIKGFSCGISCYTDMELFLVGERVFVSIWGKLIDGDVSGVYELKNSAWEKIASFSPTDYRDVYTGNDGCRFIVDLKGKSKVFDLCWL